MITFIKVKIGNLNNQKNVDKYRAAANITEYHFISKIILLRIRIPKFIMIRQLFHIKNIFNL